MLIERVIPALKGVDSRNGCPFLSTMNKLLYPLRFIGKTIARYQYIFFILAFIGLGGGGIAFIAHGSNDSSWTRPGSPTAATSNQSSTDAPTISTDTNDSETPSSSGNSLTPQITQTAPVTPSSGNNDSTPTPTVSAPDCSSYNSQMAALIAQNNAIPTFAQYTASVSQYGMTAGQAEEYHEQYAQTYNQQFANIATKEAALRAQNPACE